MATPFAVGIDNGGTWIRGVGLDGRGRRAWTFKAASPTVKNLPLFLRKKLKRFQRNLDGLAVGSRGVWKWAKHQEVARTLKGLARRVVVMSDVEAAWLAAFGHPHPRTPSPLSMEKGKKPSPYLRERAAKPGEGEGIVVIAGTGSIAYGRSADGRSARAGGLGPMIGDEGSGYWIGMKWLERRGMRDEGRGSVRQTASKAPLVIRKAKAGDLIACGIIHDAQVELANLVLQTARQLHWNKSILFAVNGSILRNTWFRLGFIKKVKQIIPQAQFIPSKANVAYALAASLLPRPLPLVPYPL